MGTLRKWPAGPLPSLLAVLLLLALLSGACSGADETPPDSPDDVLSVDAGAGDVGGGLDTQADAGAADAPTTGDGQGEAGAGSPTEGANYAYDPQLAALDLALSPAPLPTMLTVDGWVYAEQPGGQPDLVTPAMNAGSFVVPKAGETAYGRQWKVAVADASGAFGPYGNNGTTAWLVAVPAVKTPTRAIARVDNVWLAWNGGRRFPGDIYGHGKVRMPLLLQPGAPLVVRVRGGRKIRLNMQQTERALYLNDKDMTAPHLRIGRKDVVWLGVPLLNLGEDSAVEVRARVMDSAHFTATQVVWPAAAPLATTHIGFRLEPKKAWTEGDKDIVATLRVEVSGAKLAWQQQVSLPVVAADVPYRQTFRSPVDRSIQYYGVRPPKDYAASKSYGLALSLHGAGVQGLGQAQSYGAKDWLYIVAPTNRRPVGFDWEEWGHLNGLSALDDAIARFGIDITRLYVTGHSMGGHGTWQFGVHHAGRFAVVGPSAGWDSFYTYGGSAKPKGPFARARAHSDTSKYMQNLANRGVYVIHGTADDNVPWSEGLAMHLKATKVSTDVHKHWQDGAGHWWDGDKGEGADCVDWPDLFDLMKNRTLDLAELNFRFRSPGPWYSDTYSYVRIRSAAAPDKDCTVQSVFDGATLKLFTTNVRSVEIDGKAVRSKGPQSIEVDGKVHQLPDGPLRLGPETGKRPGVHGPFNQVMHRPWCWVWPDDADEYRDFAAYLASHWAIIGNGSACALPASRLSEAIAGSHNLIHLGRTPQAAGAPAFASWTDSGATMAGDTFAGAAMQLIWDAGDRLGAAIVAPKGKRFLLYSVVPFSSRSGMPDFLLWRETGGAASGNFDANWQPAPLYASGLTGGE